LLDEAINFLENDLIGDQSNTAATWGVENDDSVLQLLIEARQASKHDEFFELSEAVGLDADRLREDVCRLVAKANPHHFSALVAIIEAKLP